jgi:integrase
VDVQVGDHPARPDRWTVRRYYNEWIERKIASFVRVSAARDYRNHFRGYILDVLGDVTLEDLTLAHLEDLRTTMRKRELSEKTIRNAIDGSFRAMVRDAGQDDIPAAFPFPKVRWQEKIVPGPSPFTAEERDQILDYFKAKRWKVGGFNDTRLHYPYFAFLYTLFFTGMRPSEAVAVRIGSLNLGARTVQVERSRHLGAEAAPKTPRAPVRTPDMEKCRGSGAADRAEGPARRLSVQERVGRADRGRQLLRPVPRRAAGAVNLAAARSLLCEGHLPFPSVHERREPDLVVGADRCRGGYDPQALWPLHPFLSGG